jgi:choline dehydrogenase-like flavoprotein
MSKHEKVDVVIVGGGAVGLVHAARLSEAGKNVLVLESGPARQKDELYSSQIWARKLKWATPHVNEFGGKDLMFSNMNMGRGFGGAAIHHYGVYPRFEVHDFDMKSTWGHGLDWPISYDDVRPYYDRVQKFVGISGDASQEPWRPPGEDYPLPPVPVFRHAQLLGEGFAKEGIHTSPIPIAALSRPYNDRDACLWDGWCDAGCPIDAINNPLSTYMPRAQKGGAKFRADCHVTRVLTNQKGDKAIGVEYADSDGKRHEQLADVVVLAAFTIENARILLNSANGGLGNSSGLLGKYLMVHPAITVYGLYDEDTQCYMGTTGGMLYSQTSGQKDDNPDGVFGSRHWEIGLVLKPNDLLGVCMTEPEIFGDELHEFMKTGSQRMAAMAAICEDTPLIDNFIGLDSKKDKFGMPRAKLNYRYSPDGYALAMQAKEEGLRVVKASGAKKAWAGPVASQHICGGTIMGKDATDSVCNSYGQMHDLPNVVIGCQGTFPTCSSANTTFLAHAMAERATDYMIEHWGSVSI